MTSAASSPLLSAAATPISAAGGPAGPEPRHGEFQVVVLAGGVSSALTPLASLDTPDAVLPVVRQPLLSYPLNLLEKAGFSEVFVAVEADCIAPVAAYVQTRTASPMNVHVVGYEGGKQSAEVLRQLAPRLKGDVMVIRGDVISVKSINELADRHRANDASMTMVFKEIGAETDARGRPVKVVPEAFVGLSGDHNRVVLVESFEEEGEEKDNKKSVPISKPLLKRVPSLQIRADLKDCQMYFLSHWVLDLLGKQRSILSIEHGLVPYLISRQFREDGIPDDLVDAASSIFAEAYAMSSASTAVPAGDRVRVFAEILPVDVYCSRVTDNASFLKVNRDILGYNMSFSTPWTRLPSAVPALADSSVAEGLTLGASSKVKSSVLGAACNIGKEVTVAFSVLMNEVTIQDKCKVQNTVCCAGVVVGAGSSLKDCFVGPNVTIPPKTEAEGKSFD